MTTHDGPFAFPAGVGRTGLLLVPDGGGLPAVAWLGTTDGADATQLAAARALARATPLLVEHYRSSYTRPGLRGHRLAGAAGEPPAGRDWSTAFATDQVEATADTLAITARDEAAGLGLRTEVESVPGGALRLRHVLTNLGAAPYAVEGLEVCLPLTGPAEEVLDFTGRHEHERVPQRHEIRDGLWLRENRRGRTGLESASVLVVGPRGFGFEDGELVGVHVAFSGNSLLWVERDPGGPAIVGAGEYLLPGEIVLAQDESYATPWVFVSAATGLDALATRFHEWLRAQPAHPADQPVILNVWEAVYFDHDLERLNGLAERAARIGVERFVLDDGWFLGRRDDFAGLGDWWVDEAVWPKGLHPLVDRVRELGMQFGLWFEPEMVNPDSALYREHPDWILSAGGRTPRLWRNQLVLDLTNPEVWNFLLERLDAILTEYPIDYVKWDHNRDLLEAGSGPDGRPAAHRQALAHYALLDELRARHPRVAWESCAAGGGRIDLGVLERVQRVWTSDMTDSRARQGIQRWTAQFAAPEYLGAHVSATLSHQTGRVLSLDYRAATALFGAFGIEWDLTQADDDELDRLAEWVARYQRLRPLLHSGRVFRQDPGDDTVWVHGVVAADGREALLAHVQLDEAPSNRGVVVRIPGLVPDALYDLTWEGPVDTHRMSQAPPVDPAGPTAGVPVSGRILSEHGVVIPRRRPDTILLVHAKAQI